MTDEASDVRPSIGDAPPPIRILTMQEVPEKPAYPPGVEGEQFAVFGQDREQHDLTVGQVMVIPRWNWHEARNVTDEPCQVFHFFAGVGDIADIGFELWSEAVAESRPASTAR